MRIYFLLEDSKSFLDVLPTWMGFLNPKYKRVQELQVVEENSYVLHSGHGFPQILKYLDQTIKDIAESKNVDLLVVVLDTDDKSVSSTKALITEHIEKYETKLPCACKVLPISRCFETWLIGNNEVYPDETCMHPNFRPYHEFYDASINDPELMDRPTGSSVGRYHENYLKFMLRYKWKYSKSNPSAVATEDYLNGIITRIDETPHLSTFKDFWNLIGQI